MFANSAIVVFGALRVRKKTNKKVNSELQATISLKHVPVKLENNSYIFLFKDTCRIPKLSESLYSIRRLVIDQE